MSSYKGDNWQAFDGAPIEIEFDTDGKEVSKALFVINKGAIVKTYSNPISPIFAELTEEDTRKLSNLNVGKLIVFDSQNRKLTMDGSLNFTAEEEVYNEG